MNLEVIGTEVGLWEMIWGAGPMVKFVLLVLLFFSVMSWAIIIYKLNVLRKVEKETLSFYDLFWEKRKFSNIYTACKGYRHTPLVKLFTTIYMDLMQLKKSSEESGVEGKYIQAEDIDRLKRLLNKVSTVETLKLERAVSFLATTGNTAPFIGLFGTVWGIMNSFRGIGAKGAASLAVVAPGISEALVATAMGLLAAIPAVVAYNHIITRIERLRTEMDNFSADLLNIVERKVAKRETPGLHRDL